MKVFPGIWIVPAVTVAIVFAPGAMGSSDASPGASQGAGQGVSPDVKVDANLEAATHLFNEGRYEAALPLAQRAAAARPENVTARVLLGRILTRMERAEEAVATLTAAAKDDPKNAGILVHLGEAQMTQYVEGIEAWKRVHGDSPMLGTITSDIPGAMAGGSHRYAPGGGPVLGETDKASELTRKPNDWRDRRFDPGHSAMGMLRRSVATMTPAEREKHELPARSARTAFEQALEQEPGDSGALRGRAYALFALGEFSEAGAAFDRAAQATPTDVVLPEMAAEAYMRVDASNDAIRAWERVINLNPVHKAAYKNLVDLYGSFRRSRWERRYYMAMDRLLSGKAKQALGDLRWITEVHPDYAPGWRALGSAYLATKDPKKAIESLDKALEIDPENGLTEYELGVAHLQNSETSAARAHLTKSAALRPDYAPAWFSLGVVAEKEKDPDSAIAAYERAVELRPNWAEAHFNLGALLLDRRHGAEAVEHLEQYIALKPDAPDAPEVRKALEQVRALDKQS